MKAALIPGTLALLLALSTASCKRGGDDDGGGPNCRLATVHQVVKTSSIDATTKLTYDSTGRLISTLTSGSSSKVRNFTYKSDTVYIKETNGLLITDYKVVRNNYGNLKYLAGYRTGTSDIGFTVRYDYNGSGRVFSQTTTYYPGSPTVYTNSYNAAGDAINAKNPATPNAAGITYEYYTDQPFQVGDATAVENFINYGAHAVTNAHLLHKSTSVGSTGASVVTEYNYVYGSGGRITQATMLGTGGSVYDYTYNCQ